jgi:hypothetical protein
MVGAKLERAGLEAMNIQQIKLAVIENYRFSSSRRG